MFDLKGYNIQFVLDEFLYNKEPIKDEKTFNRLRELSYYEYVYILNEVICKSDLIIDKELLYKCFQILPNKKILSNKDLFVISKLKTLNHEEIYNEVEKEIKYLDEFKKIQKIYFLRHSILYNVDSWIENLTKNLVYLDEIMNTPFPHTFKFYNIPFKNENHVGKSLLNFLHYLDAFFRAHLDYAFALLIANTHTTIMRFFMLEFSNVKTPIINNQKFFHVSPLIFELDDWKKIIIYEIYESKIDVNLLKNSFLESLDLLDSELFLNSDYETPIFPTDIVRISFIEKREKFDFRDILETTITNFKMFIEYELEETLLKYKNSKQKELVLYSKRIELKNVSPYKLHQFIVNYFNQRVCNLDDDQSGRLMSLFYKIFDWNINQYKNIPKSTTGIFNLYNKDGLRAVLIILTLLHKNNLICYFNHSLVSDLLIFNLKDDNINQRLGLSDRLRKELKKHDLMSKNELAKELNLENNQEFVGKIK